MDFPREKEYPEGYISVRHPESDDCHSYVRMNMFYRTWSINSRIEHVDQYILINIIR